MEITDNSIEEDQTQMTLMIQTMMMNYLEEDHQEDHLVDWQEDHLTLMTLGYLEDQEDLTVIQEEDPHLEALLEDHPEALEAHFLKILNQTDYL